MGQNTKAVGFTDEAATKDLFDIDSYISGLTKFIKNCRTPMTVSIQGSWGTGKTTVMNITHQKLQEDKKIRLIWFNTWQFSQFHMDDALALSFLECLVKELDISEESKKEASKITQSLRKVGAVSREALLSIIDSKVGGRFAENLERAFDVFISDEQNSSIDAVKKLKMRFEHYIRETLEREEKDRIVVFIDDLDRLEPRKAVELLEVLKIFLDSPSCVFVMAIDYEVVIRGVKDKYGFSDSEKGRSFFDKIIQVPFKLPIANYNITNYVAKCLEEIGIDCDESEQELYERLIETSIGANPRAMKRLFNAYLLHQYVAPEDIWKERSKRHILFTILCIQYADEEFYNLLTGLIDEISMNDFRGFKEEGKSILSDSMDSEDVDRWGDFVSLMSKLLMEGVRSNEEAMKRFRETVALSSITSSAEKKRGRREIEELNGDYEVDKKLTPADVKNHICNFSNRFHVGYDRLVGVEYNGKYYHAKMHSSVPGRVDRLAQFYKEYPMEAGDVLHARYVYSENCIHLVKKR